MDLAFRSFMCFLLSTLLCLSGVAVRTISHMFVSSHGAHLITRIGNIIKQVRREVHSVMSADSTSTQSLHMMQAFGCTDHRLHSTNSARATRIRNQERPPCSFCSAARPACNCKFVCRSCACSLIPKMHIPSDCLGCRSQPRVWTCRM